MYGAYPYNPQSTIRVEETVTVFDDKVFLHHIPKEGSVMIDGFTEVDGEPQQGQFSCDYATDSLYRDSNRVLNFHLVDDFTELTVNYIAIGTVLTADIWNEIKAHMENQELHGGGNITWQPYFYNIIGGQVGFDEVLFLTGNPDDVVWSYGSDVYQQLTEQFDTVWGAKYPYGAPNGAIVFYIMTNADLPNRSWYGYAAHFADNWYNLGAQTGTFNGWNCINPLLSVKDRQKLDNLTEPYQIGDGLYLQNNKLYLQTANANSFGGVKVGDGLQLNNSAALCLKAATASQLGGIKIGNGLVKDLHEVLSVDLPLSNADRKLLDYLHELYDEHIP